MKKGERRRGVEERSAEERERPCKSELTIVEDVKGAKE